MARAKAGAKREDDTTLRLARTFGSKCERAIRAFSGPAELKRWFGPIDEYDVGGRVAFREYYDLRHDPYELTNLLDDVTVSNDPDVAALHRRLAADRTCSGRTCP